MENQFDIISKKSNKRLPKIFNKEYEADVIVDSTNIETGQIIVKHNSYVLNCITKQNISNLNFSDEIKIKFKFVIQGLNMVPMILFCTI